MLNIMSYVKNVDFYNVFNQLIFVYKNINVELKQMLRVFIIFTISLFDKNFTTIIVNKTISTSNLCKINSSKTTRVISIRIVKSFISRQINRHVRDNLNFYFYLIIIHNIVLIQRNISILIIEINRN